MLRHRAASVVFLLAAALPAWAQPASKAPSRDTGWIGIVIALVLAAGVIIASLTGSKRGHQD